MKIEPKIGQIWEWSGYSTKPIVYITTKEVAWIENGAFHSIQIDQLTRLLECPEMGCQRDWHLITDEFEKYKKPDCAEYWSSMARWHKSVGVFFKGLIYRVPADFQTWHWELKEPEVVHAPKNETEWCGGVGDHSIAYADITCHRCMLNYYEATPKNKGVLERMKELGIEIPEQEPVHYMTDNRIYCGADTSVLTNIYTSFVKKVTCKECIEVINNPKPKYITLPLEWDEHGCWVGGERATEYPVIDGYRVSGFMNESYNGHNKLEACMVPVLTCGTKFKYALCVRED